jgi:hypothetical protein
LTGILWRKFATSVRIRDVQKTADVLALKSQLLHGGFVLVVQAFVVFLTRTTTSRRHGNQRRQHHESKHESPFREIECEP